MMIKLGEKIYRSNVSEKIGDYFEYLKSLKLFPTISKLQNSLKWLSEMRNLGLK